MHFFQNILIKYRFHSNRSRVTSTLHEDQYTFLTISLSVLLILRNVSDQICRENLNTFCVQWPLFYFIFLNGVVCEIMWINTVEPDRPQMTIWRMHIARWIPKSTNTYSEYVIFNAFLLQHCLHQRASTLRYKYIALFTDNGTNNSILTLAAHSVGYCICSI